MNHKVRSVQELYDDANRLYHLVVTGGMDTSADTIIGNLASGISILKGCWEGKDAGVQIQNLVTVHNAMVDIRNALASLAVESSRVASNYRMIQNSNGAGFEQLTVLVQEDKTRLPDYTDSRDTVGITPEADNGKSRIDMANNSIDGFIQEVKKYYSMIMDNWTVGAGRDTAREAFQSFITSSASYKETLQTVSNSIATALKNYSF